MIRGPACSAAREDIQACGERQAREHFVERENIGCDLRLHNFSPLDFLQNL